MLTDTNGPEGEREGEKLYISSRILILIDWMNSEGIRIAFFSNLKFRSLSAKVNNVKIV